MLPHEEPPPYDVMKVVPDGITRKLWLSRRATYNMLDNKAPPPYDTVKVLPADHAENNATRSGNPCRTSISDRYSSIDENIVSETLSSAGDVRGRWGGQFEFVLSVVGYTVGLGNIWRFPYLVFRNGGGAFLIPFFIFLVLCGGPLYYMEVCLGQFSGKSPIVVWDICPLFKGLGVLMTTISMLYLWYFGVVFAWVLYFLVQSFYPTLPWATCGNSWNTDRCTDFYSNERRNRTDVIHNITLSTNNLTSIYSTINTTTVGTTDVPDVRTAATEYWQYNVLKLSPGIHELGAVNWPIALCLLIGWLLVFLCLAKGVKSVGKVVYVTATAPYLLLTVLLVRGVTLDGAVDGLKMYLRPDFSRLLEVQIWMEAAVQVFYSLGPAWGGVITMASFNDFHHNALRDTVIVVVADAFTAFYGGLVVFSVLGFLAKETGRPMSQFATTGPGLAFIAYPEALSRLPLPQLWSVLFFTTLVFIGIDTQFGTFETTSNAVIDLYLYKLHGYRVYIAAFLVTLLFLAGLPLTTSGGYFIFLLADWYTATFNVVTTAILECIIVAWIYGAHRFGKDMEMMTGRQTGLVLRICWCAVIPVFLGTILIMAILTYSPPTYGKGGYIFPLYAVAIGNVIAVAPIATAGGIAAWMILREKGSISQRMERLLRPGSGWEPNSQKDRQVYRQNPYVYERHWLRRIVVNSIGLKWR